MTGRHFGIERGDGFGELVTPADGLRLGTGSHGRVDVSFAGLGDDNSLQRLFGVKQREIARRLSTYRGELELGHPKFPEGSQAALVNEKGGCSRSDLPPIQYGKEDDEAIEQWIRGNLNTTWHSSKQKPRLAISCWSESSH